MNEVEAPPPTELVTSKAERATSLVADMHRLLGLDERAASLAQTAALIDSHLELFPPYRLIVGRPVIDVAGDLRLRRHDCALIQAARDWCGRHDRWEAQEQERASLRAAIVAASQEYERAIVAGDEPMLLTSWARRQILERKLPTERDEQVRQADQGDLQAARQLFSQLWRQYAMAMDAYYSQEERVEFARPVTLIVPAGIGAPVELARPATDVEQTLLGLIGELPERARTKRQR